MSPDRPSKPAPAGANGESTASARRRVLVVDDSAAIRASLRYFLSEQGFDVTEAANCAVALQEFRAHRPDIALVDYMLPDGDALGLLPQLKAISANTPIIVLTAHGTIDLAVRAIKEGAEQFLTKPF